MKPFLLLLLILQSLPALAGCKHPAPPAMAYLNAGGGCPSGYYSSHQSCVPHSSSARYAFANPDGRGCPSGYASSGKSCVAHSSQSCHAYYTGGGSCPPGYARSGSSCVSF